MFFWEEYEKTTKLVIHAIFRRKYLSSSDVKASFTPPKYATNSAISGLTTQFLFSCFGPNYVASQNSSHLQVTKYSPQPSCFFGTNISSESDNKLLKILIYNPNIHLNV